MKVLPYILYRTTNRNFDELLNLNLKEIFHFSAQYEIDLAQFQSEINLSTDTLFSLIQRCQNDEERKILINIKRDIHNQRTLKKIKLSKIQGENNTVLQKLLESYSLKKTNLDSSSGKLSDSYIEETKRSRKKLKVLFMDELFKKGIVLSSASIFQSLNNYINDNAKLSLKKRTQIENGLIKYLSRFYAKTSPFSTFTSIGLLKYEPVREKFNSCTESETLSTIKSHVSVNTNIFLLFKSFLVKHDSLKFKIPLKLNPTLTLENDKYVFLTNNYHNVESIQRLKWNPFINSIVASLKDTKDSNTEMLVQILMEKGEFDNTEQEIKEYIWHLVHTGFFELDLKTSGLDPDCINTLRQFLTNYLPSENKSVLDLIHLVDLLLNGTQKISNADSSDRFLIIDEIFKNVSTMFGVGKKESKKPGPDNLADNNSKENSESKKNQDDPFLLKYDLPVDISPEKIFFEDTLTNKNYSLSKSFVNETCLKLKNLIEHLWIFEPNNAEKQITKDFFVKTYGKDSIVPVLKFYEDFYAYYLHDKSKENEKNPAGSYWSALSKKWTQSFYDYTDKDRLQNKENVCFDLNDLISVNKNAGVEIRKNYKTSIGIFFQVFVNESKQDSCVINSLFCGFGKLFSRFLYVLDTDLLTSIKEHIKTTLTGDISTCETADTSIMNANIHPPIMEYEISMPFGNAVLPEEKRIPINRVLIRFDKNADELKLVDMETKKEIYVYYLGFQNFDYRSKLFQMLVPFSNFMQPMIYTFTEMINTKFYKVNNINEDDPVQIKPRITYGDTIVIQRKTITVKQIKLPPVDSKLTDDGYFLYVQKWKQEIGLPEMVFVRMVLPQGDTGHLLGHDDRKPQFIDFRNAFLVKLFEKICSKAKNGLEFTEMLPAYDHLSVENREKFVTEFLVEYYS